MTNLIKLENKCLNKDCNNNELSYVRNSTAQLNCNNCNLIYTISNRNYLLEILLKNNAFDLFFYALIIAYGYTNNNYKLLNINLIDEIIHDFNEKKFIDIQDVINNIFYLDKFSQRIINLEIFQ